MNFFDTSNFQEYAEGLGNKFNGVSICIPLYKSQICVIVGSEKSKEFPKDKVIIFDLSSQKEIGSIKLNLEDEEKVYKVYVNIKTIFIVLKDKILFFDLIKLSYLGTIEDVKGETQFVSFGCTREENLTPHITVAYVSFLNEKIVKIAKVFFSSQAQIPFISYHTLATDFESIQFISVSSKCKFLAVVSGSGEKVNIYSLKNYKARKYLWRGYSKVQIVDIVFDEEDKFLCLFSTQKTFHIYPLLRRYLNPRAKGTEAVIEEEKGNIEDQDQDYYNYGKRKPNKVKRMFKSIRKNIGRKYKDSFAKYKDDKILTDEIVYFYFNHKLDIIAYDKYGRVLIIKFNKRKGGMCWLHQTKYLEVTEF